MKTRLILRPESLHSFSKSVKFAWKRLPPLQGRSIRVRFLPALTAGNRKVYSNRSHGQPVYAATFIRRRRVILDQDLARRPKELARILTHELFHFVWVRLSNRDRQSYESVLRREWVEHARGELGWSAELRKSGLTRSSGTARSRKKWRDYACESFCDTAAWLYSGVRRHPEFTLAARHRARRAVWFQATLGRRQIPI